LNAPFGILPDAAFHVTGQRFELPGQPPGSLIFHLAPEAVDRMEFRTIRGHQQTHPMVWEDERCGRMAAPLIHQHDLQRVVRAACTFLENDWTSGGVQRWELQQKARTRWGCDRPIHGEVLETLLHCSHRLNATPRHTSTLDRQQANATGLLAKDADRAPGRWRRHRPDLGQGGLPPSWKRPLTCHHVLGVCFSASSWGPAAPPAAGSGRTSAPVYRRAPRPTPAPAIPSWLGHW
jgi:hypothetical protein